MNSPVPGTIKNQQKQSPFNLQFLQGMTLKRQLLAIVLPTTILPLLVASGVGYNIIQRQARQEELNQLQEEAARTADVARVVMEDAFEIPKVVGLDPGILKSLKQADQIAQRDGLVSKSIDELEEEFGSTKLLNPSEEINEYLRNVAKAENLVELFITDKRGLTIAYSNRTSDFVQSDEEWWERAKEDIFFVDAPAFDESANAFAIDLSEAILLPSTGEFLGVIKAVIPTEVIDNRISAYGVETLENSQIIQVLDIPSGTVFATITPETVISTQGQTLEGGETIQAAAANVLTGTLNSIGDLDGVKMLQNEQFNRGGTSLGAIIQYGQRKYSIVGIPGTPWAAIASESIQEFNQAGLTLLLTLGTTAAVLGLVSTAVLTKLLEQIQLLVTRQKQLTQEQQDQRAELETDISQLMEDIGDAAGGDLTVRAQLSAGDVGIVADLFNVIVENLRDTAIRVKSTTDQVGQSLTSNESEIQQFSQQASAEIQSLQETVTAMQTMDQSIQSVAERASQAATLTQDTYATVQVSSQSMDETVNSIVSLRSTVGETAKKIKRLGESAQKISQTVSLIDEIALKTNLLAVNASVEAARAGELGQGFTAVAEQVGALAEQSAQATKDIAKIVADIQIETQEVVTAIETNTTQVIDSSEQVETTKQQLKQVLAKSEEITQLMNLISDSTVEQTQASTAVTTLMQQATQASEVRSNKSTQIAQAIRETALAAQELQESVEQFKVADQSSVPVTNELSRSQESVEREVVSSL
ncbi:MAG: methyl-accepting chemotaxis protein [Cyanobacteria bacterium P01_F01_bin.150]